MDSSLSLSSNKFDKLSSFKEIKEILNYSKEKYSERSCLGSRRDNTYNFKSYKQVINEIENIKNYFTHCINSENEIYVQYMHNEIEYNLIGIYTKPCQEVLKIMLSIHIIDSNVTIAPIFDNIQVNELKKIFIETKIKTLIVDYSCLRNLIKNWDKLNDDQISHEHICSSSIKNFILIDEEFNNDKDILDFIQDKKINFIKYSEILDFKNEQTLENLKNRKNKLDLKDKIILLNYTSGGKGVLISEKSLISTFNCLLSNQHLKEDNLNIYYSLTSLADTPEYLNNLLNLYQGHSIGYFSGDYSKIFEDIQILKPTIIYSYPRVFFKIYEALQAILSKLDDSKRNLIDKAIKTKVEKINKEKSLNHHIWDKVVFNKIKNSLGGNINLLIVSGHLLPHVGEFLKVCLSTDIVEIYGVAETCGIISISHSQEHDNEYIGSINDINLYEIMKNEKVGFYSSHNLKLDNYIKSYGEICISGENLFSGYLKSESENKTLGESESDKNHYFFEGYFRTGDYVNLFEMNKILNLKFIDRIENFIKTSQGFLVSPTLLEEFYSASEFISEITIVSDQSTLVAIVILNKNKKSNSCEDKIPRKGSFNGNVLYRTAKEKRMRSASTLEKTDSNSNLNALSRTSSTSDSDDGNSLKNEDPLFLNPNDNEILKEDILKSFHVIWMKNKLKDHEIIDKVFILDRNIVPTVENGMLTCKMKLKREKMEEIYKKSFTPCEEIIIAR
jgi:long-subunit acyl-CoA synthetase (AMP-forming)